MSAVRLQLERTAVLVVDVQEKLLPVMDESDHVLQQIGKLVDGAAALQLPTLVTEQYRQGLGCTVQQLATKLTHAVCNEEKMSFSACIEPICHRLKETGTRSVLVCGIEAHVCVLQSCLDLIDAGFIVAVVVDAIGSRRAVDRESAVQRMVQAGVLPTTVEAALLELVHEAGSDRFKAVLPIIK